MVFSLTWLPETLEAAGLKVAEVPGWRTRGRGEMGVVKGVMCHHTATNAGGNMPTLKSLINGRPDLQGPLCQLGLGRDGTFYVVAAGRANHAGGGEWNGVTTGNSSFIGIEAENTGIGEADVERAAKKNPPKRLIADPWPEVQLDAYRRGVAAILSKVGAAADMCCAHKEYALPSGRKSDPHTIEMNEFRKDVAAIMAGGGKVRPMIPTSDSENRATLRRGSEGDSVKLVQKKLGVAQTGFFGPTTEAAVRQLQRLHDLVGDGIVGPNTWALLDSLP